MNGLELTEKALKLWNQIHPGESLYLQCQRMSWYFQWAYQGDENIVTYGKAITAARASTMFTKSVNDPAIRAGDELFWDVGTDGDVATCVGRSASGRVLVAATAKSGDTVKSLGNHVVIRHADTQPWPFLGASRANGRNKPKSGITDWPVLKLAGNQRRVAENIPANGRVGASTSTAVIASVAGLDYGTFDGWKYGESIGGNKVWFRGAFSGAYFWSGSFTDTGTHDLKSLTGASIPASSGGTPISELDGNQRRVAADIPANGRVGASTATAVIGSVEGKDFGTFDGWVTGEKISGNDVWFRGAFSGAYFWSGSFTDIGTHDLTDLNKVVVPPVVEPTPLPPARDPNLIQPKAADFPAWIQFGIKRNTRDNRAAINAEARAYYASKGQADDYFPVKQVAHWWGSPDAGYSHDGVVNTLTGKADYSVHFVVSAGRVTEVQPLNLVAYTTGSASMRSWSTENDPLLTDLVYSTLGYLTYLVELLNPRLRAQSIELHKNQINVSTGAKFQTSCSSVDVARVRAIAEGFFDGSLNPETGQPFPVEPEQPEQPTDPTGMPSAASMKVLWGAIAAALISIGTAIYQTFN